MLERDDLDYTEKNSPPSLAAAVAPGTAAAQPAADGSAKGTIADGIAAEPSQQDGSPPPEDEELRELRETLEHLPAEEAALLLDEMPLGRIASLLPLLDAGKRRAAWNVTDLETRDALEEESPGLLVEMGLQAPKDEPPGPGEQKVTEVADDAPLIFEAWVVGPSVRAVPGGGVMETVKSRHRSRPQQTSPLTYYAWSDAGAVEGEAADDESQASPVTFTSKTMEWANSNPTVSKIGEKAKEAAGSAKVLAAKGFVQAAEGSSKAVGAAGLAAVAARTNLSVAAEKAAPRVAEIGGKAKDAAGSAAGIARQATAEKIAGATDMAKRMSQGVAGIVRKR